MNIKKYGLALLPIILLILIAGLGYKKYLEIKKSNFEAIQAIPNNASIIIKTANWKESWSKLEQSNIWNQISDLDELTDFKKSIRNLSVELDTNIHLQEIFNDNPFYFSIHHEEQDFSPFLSLLLNDDQKLYFLNYFFKEKLNSRKYEEIEIYKLKNGWNVAFQEGIVFLSTSPLLVEQSIRQLKNELSLANNQSFNRVRSTESSFADMHVYVNYKQLANLIDENTSLTSKNKTQISRWANWAELDLKVKENKLLFNGFTLAEDSSSNYLTTLRNQEPISINLSQIAPSNTNKIVAIGLSDYGTYYKNYKEFLAKQNNLYEHNKWAQDVNIKYQINIENTLNAIIKNEIAIVSTYASEKNEDFVLINADKDALDILKYIGETIDKEQKIENHREYELININLPHLFSSHFGTLFNIKNNTYFTWIDGYLVFAKSPTSLKTFINNFMSGDILERNASYKLFAQNLFGKSNFLYYTNPSRGNWKDRINSNWKPFISSENWSNISAFAYQLSANNELFNNNVVLNFENKIKKESQLNWSVNLNNSILLKPQITKNHNTNKKEVFTQDTDNSIYLISTSGKILWQKFIGGKILGDVNQIDFYKNKKLQIIFNTADSLYLIDRNGNKVENYPIPLKYKAINGHTLVDYDKTKKYRILIANEQNSISNYDKQGNIVSGWKFDEMESSISNDITYLDYKGKDFIYVVDDSGNAKIVARNGKERYNFGKIPNADVFYVDKIFGYIYSSDEAGNIWASDLEGNQSKLHTSAESDHYFLAKQMNEDNIIEFIISSKNYVECYQGESLVFRTKTNNEIRPSYFQIDNNYYLGISDGDYVSLINNKGKTAFGTPVYGQGEFNCADLENDGQINLIVGNNNILYNYGLE
ncbi:MAG: hypothetical protein QNK68_06630 [Flavobacteriales bacterium]